MKDNTPMSSKHPVIQAQSKTSEGGPEGLMLPGGNFSNPPLLAVRSVSKFGSKRAWASWIRACPSLSLLQGENNYSEIGSQRSTSSRSLLSQVRSTHTPETSYEDRACDTSGRPGVSAVGRFEIRFPLLTVRGKHGAALFFFPRLQSVRAARP